MIIYAFINVVIHIFEHGWRTQTLLTPLSPELRYSVVCKSVGGLQIVDQSKP